MREGGIVPMMIPMRTTLGVAALVLCGACSIYGGDDVPGEDVDGGGTEIDAGPGPDATTTTYSVSWECVSTECYSPIATEDTAAVRDDGRAVRVSWYRLGSSVPAGAHDGLSGDCLSIYGSDEGGLRRDAYSMCPIVGSDVPAMRATITWNNSTWRATLARI